MGDVIFARPRWDYASYTDLYDLIMISGYPFIYIDEIDPQSDNTYICTIANGENKAGWQNPRARIILYDLEWHLDGVDIPGLYDVWAADAWYAQKIGARYVPLGSHPDLKNGWPTPAIPVYDAATLWYVTPRRQTVLTHMAQHDVLIAPPCDQWGEQRHKLLSASRSMVHVHQRDDAFTVAPQRFALAAAYKLPIITETLADEGIFTNSYRLMSDFRHLGEFVAMWTRSQNTQRLQDYGHALHQLLCVDHTFRKVVDANV